MNGRTPWSVRRNPGGETDEATGEHRGLRGSPRAGPPHRRAVWLNALHREAVSFKGFYVAYAQVEVRDELDEAGRGTHERFIIDGAQRLPRLQEKLNRWKAARA